MASGAATARKTARPSHGQGVASRPRARVRQEPESAEGEQQARGEFCVQPDARHQPERQPPARTAAAAGAPEQPADGGPERHLGVIMIELRSRPAEKIDRRHEENSGKRTALAEHVTRQQIDEDEGRRNRELRQQVLRPAEGACQQMACFEQPAGKLRVLVGQKHPFAAPHEAFHDIAGRCGIDQRRRQRPAHGLRQAQQRQQPPGVTKQTRPGRRRIRARGRQSCRHPTIHGVI